MPLKVPAIPSANAHLVDSLVRPAVSCPSMKPPQYIARSATSGAVLVMRVAKAALSRSG